MTNPITRKRIDQIRSTVATEQPIAAALSDLRVCDIIVWMAEHGSRGPE